MAKDKVELKSIEVMKYLRDHPGAGPTKIAQDLWDTNYNDASGAALRILKPLMKEGLTLNNKGKYSLSPSGEKLLNSRNTNG